MDRGLTVFKSHDMKRVVNTTVCVLYVLQSSGPPYLNSRVECDLLHVLQTLKQEVGVLGKGESKDGE